MPHRRLALAYLLHRVGPEQPRIEVACDSRGDIAMEEVQCPEFGFAHVQPETRAQWGHVGLAGIAVAPATRGGAFLAGRLGFIAFDPPYPDAPVSRPKLEMVSRALVRTCM